MRNHVILGVFFQDTLICDGYWLWAWRFSWGVQNADLHCRKVESTKFLKHKLRATIGGQ